MHVCKCEGLLLPAHYSGGIMPLALQMWRGEFLGVLPSSCTWPWCLVPFFVGAPGLGCSLQPEEGTPGKFSPPCFADTSWGNPLLKGSPASQHGGEFTSWGFPPCKCIPELSARFFQDWVLEALGVAGYGLWTATGLTVSVRCL